MRTYRRCKRLWYLSHYRQLKRRTENQFNRPLGIGNRIHDALAAYYSPDPAESKNPLEFVRESIATDLAKFPEHEEDIQKEADLCDAIISGYLEWLAETGADQAMRVIEAEKAVHVDLLDGVRLLSKLDARVEHEELGGRFSLEHKSVSGSVKPPAHLRFDTQFLTEHMVELVWLRDNEREDQRALGVLWNALLKSKRTARAKGPFYAREVVRHNLEQLRNHWHHVSALAVEILDTESRLDSGESHQSACHPNPMDRCSWDCPFVGVCLNMDANEDNAERQLAAQYEPGDVLARYRGLLPSLVESDAE